MSQPLKPSINRGYESVFEVEDRETSPTLFFACEHMLYTKNVATPPPPPAQPTTYGVPFDSQKNRLDRIKYAALISSRHNLHLSINTWSNSQLNMRVAWPVLILSRGFIFTVMFRQRMRLWYLDDNMGSIVPLKASPAEDKYWTRFRCI